MKTTLILCTFALASWLTNPANAKSQDSTKTMQTDSTLVDPVCKMKVKQPSKITSIYKENKYAFCNITCKVKFDKNPKKHIKK